jgi:hypothetical protein
MCRASHRTRDAGIIEAHIVSRPDLVRIDQDGYPSEIATLIRRRRREPYPLPGQVLQFAPGNSVEIYLGAIQVISGVILTRQVRAEPQRFDLLGGTRRPTKTLTRLYKSDPGRFRPNTSANDPLKWQRAGRIPGAHTKPTGAGLGG